MRIVFVCYCLHCCETLSMDFMMYDGGDLRLLVFSGTC